MTTPISTEAIIRDLRLKRRFLQTLVASFGAGALVAVVVLLIGEFDETTARVLITLGGLALHSGVAMGLAAAIERRFVPTLSQIGLVLFAANFAVFVTGVWWPGGLDMPALRATLTTLALLGAAVIVTPGADLLERNQWRPVALPGVVLVALALVMTLVCIWGPETDNAAFPKATAIVAIVAFSVAQACLLLRVPGAATLTAVLGGTIAAIAVVAGMATFAIITEIENDLYYRVFGAAGVLDACGALVLLILAKLRQVGRVAGLESATPQVEITCPRCTTRQNVAAGASKCATCGLKFRIEIQEPCCEKCGYLLWQLPDRRCPECGTAF
jgi:hypothetical protein